MKPAEMVQEGGIPTGNLIKMNPRAIRARIPRAEVRSQQMVTTPITELYSDIIQKDRGYEPDFSI